MSTKVIAVSSVLLRILTILASVACMMLLVTDSVKDEDGSKVTFKDLKAYRFVLSTAVISAAYNLVQLPFAMYYSMTEKRLVAGRFLVEFDFYGDKVIGFLVASGVGAGFAVTCEFKKFLDDIFNLLESLSFAVEGSKKSAEKFLDRGLIATGVLLFSFVTMAILSIISSITLAKKSGGFFR